MRTQRVLLRLIVILALCLPTVHADDFAEAEKAELARQEAFQAGVAAIVEDLNAGSFNRLIASIDRQDMVERIFGLRLIDQKIKRSFQDNLEYSYDAMIEGGFVVPEDGLKATLLGLESRGDRGRAVLRFDLPKTQFAYHEYDLRLDDRGRVVVVDWLDFSSGLTFSESVGRPLVMVAPSKPAMRKLLDFQNVRDSELFQFGELLKAARDRRLDRYLEIRDGMDERFRRQRIVVESTVDTARKARKRRQWVAALKEMADYYPDEPLYTLMLLNYYLPARKYEEARTSLQLLADRLDVEDPAMDARLSALTLVLGDVEAATALADKARAAEPTLELAWWSTLDSRAAAADYAGCVEALKTLEAEFGHDLGPETLQKNPAYAQLIASAEFKAWRDAAN